MKIELLAALDLIEVLIKRKNYQSLHGGQIESLFEKYRESELTEQIYQDIQDKKYDQALEAIGNYRMVCKELLTIYNAMAKDYCHLREQNLQEEIVEILNEKYGVSKISEVVSLLELKFHVQQSPELAHVK